MIVVDLGKPSGVILRAAILVDEHIQILPSPPKLLLKALDGGQGINLRL
jgi:hypothetical protein